MDSLEVNYRDRQVLMLLSKLDQRCEAAFVHIRMKSRVKWRGGGERQTVLFVR